MFRQPTAQTSDFAIDSGSLPGPLSIKLKVARDAGFEQVLLSATDLTLHPQGVDAAIADVRAAGLRVTALQGLDGFNGWEGPHREFKFKLARTLLELCKSVQAPLLVARTSHLCEDDARAQDLLVADLRRLAVLAIPFDVQIAYESVPDPVKGRELTHVLDIIDRVDMPNVGVCLDASCVPAEALGDEHEGLGIVSLVRVADEMPSGAPAAGGGAHTAVSRVFPGEGLHGIRMGEAIKHLERHGYRGPWVFDADHPDYRFMPAGVAADRAGRSARWLAEDVLRRSVPLPDDLLAVLRPSGTAGTSHTINNP